MDKNNKIIPRNDLQALGGYDKIQDPNIPAYDAKSGLLTDYGKNLGLKEVNLPTNLNTADATKVGAIENVTTPVLNTTSSATGGVDAINAITEANKTSLVEQDKANAEITALQAEQKTGKSAIQTIFDRLRGTNKEKDTLYKETGVDSARQSVDELTSLIESETLSARRKVEDIRANFKGTTAGANAMIDVANKESFSKLADLSIVQNAALRKYSTMKDIADRQIDAETEDLKLELEGLKFFYEDNKDSLTKKEDRLYQEKIKEKDRAYNEAYDAKKLLSDTKIELLKSASSQGASTSTLQAIQKATSPEAAVGAAGKYSGDILDRLYKKAQIDKIYADIGGGGKDELLSIDEAAKLGVPYGTTKAEAISSIKGNEGKPAPLNPTQKSALTSAASLLEKFNAGKGTSAVGKSGFLGSFGAALIPGTERADFVRQFDNLKSLLALDNVKLLKGQGAVSDAERKLLSDAATKLDRAQSETEFKTTLEDIVRVFNKATPEYQFVDELTGGAIDSSGTSLSADAYARSLLAQ